MKTINEAQIEGFTNEFIRAFLDFGKTGSDESAMTLYWLLQENPDQLIDIRKLPQLTKEEYPYLDQCDEEKKIKIKAGKNKGKRNKKFYDLWY